MYIKDKIGLGTAAGMLGTIPQLIFDTILVKIHYSEYYAFQLSGSIFLLEEYTRELFGFLIGGFIWEAIAAFLGVLIVFLLHLTGTAYWWLKGISISIIVMFIGMYGFLYTLGAATIVPFGIPTNLTILIGNLIFGVTTAFFAVRWGD